MDIQIDKRFDIPASSDQAWAVLRDIRAVAGCMPGAQITEQTDDTHYVGVVKTKVGPAVMSFAGQVELLGLDVPGRALEMLAKGADKAGSSASMKLSARVEPGATPEASLLIGQATVSVSGKLAQFGNRLLVPVSDAMLEQFAQNFRTAASAVQVSGAPPSASTAVSAAVAPPPAPTAPRELNALALMWQVFKGWLAGLFGRR